MLKKLFFCLCFLILVGCSANIELSKNVFTIELGQDVYANPSLYVKNPEEINTSELEVMPVSGGIHKKENRFVTSNMDYLVVGEYDFKLITPNKTFPFKIKIKDTKPPTFNDNFSVITVPKDEEIDWQAHFSASDLSGVSYDVSPEIDASASGSYSVKVKISDRFGNTAEKEITVKVE